MAYYYKLGNIPSKRHIQFRQPDQSLYYEELVSSKGFSGIYSNLYHIYPPTRVHEVLQPVKQELQMLKDRPLLQTHLNTSKAGITGGDYLEARKVLMMNNDLSIAICHPSKKSMNYYYKKGEADELL